MSRFSPTVQVQPFTGFQDAIRMFEQAREEKRQQGIQDAELAQHGIYKGTAPQPDQPSQYNVTPGGGDPQMGGGFRDKLASFLHMGQQAPTTQQNMSALQSGMGAMATDAANENINTINQRMTGAPASVPKPSAPGAFNPLSASFEPVTPRYKQVGDYYVDQQYSPLNMEKLKLQNQWGLRDMMTEAMLARTGMQQQGANERTDKNVGAKLTTVGMQQEGQNSRLGTTIQARSDLQDTKGDQALEQIAARGKTQMGIAQLRASLHTDPKNMTPLQRVNLYQKIAQRYVGGANGDMNEAVETAKNDPHLQDLGVTADQIQGYIGAAAMAVKQKRDAGDAQGALKLLSSFASATPDEAIQTVQTVKHKVQGNPPAPTPSVDPFGDLVPKK